MEYASRERYLATILADGVFTEFDGVVYTIRHPDHNIRGLSVLVYDKIIADALSHGLMSQDELLDMSIKIGLWTVQKEKRLSLCRELLYDQKKELLDFLLNTTALQNRRLRLRQIERDLCELIGQKQTVLQDSAESCAALAQQRFLVGRTAYRDRDPVWEADAVFGAEKNLRLVHALCKAYFLDAVLSSAIIRELSRSTPWREMWSAGKQSQEIFGLPVCDLGHNQLDLIRWSAIYDSALGACERPDARIIEDDDLFDSWLIRQSEQQDSRAKACIMDKRSQGANKGGDKRELFVMTDAAGAREVYAANDKIARREVAHRQKQLAVSGVAKETDFLDSQRILREKARQQASRKDISRR